MCRIKGTTRIGLQRVFSHKNCLIRMLLGTNPFIKKKNSIQDNFIRDQPIYYIIKIKNELSKVQLIY